MIGSVVSAARPVKGPFVGGRRPPQARPGCFQPASRDPRRLSAHASRDGVDGRDARLPVDARSRVAASRDRARVAAPVRAGGGGGSFRVIEYGDGTTPDERRAASAGREDDRGDRDRPGRGRGARGGPEGAKREAAGPPGAATIITATTTRRISTTTAARAGGSLRERGRGGRGVFRSAGSATARRATTRRGARRAADPARTSGAR